LANFAAEHVVELDKKRQILGASFGSKPGTTFLRSWAETLVKISGQMGPSDKINPMEVLREHFEEYRANLSEEDAAALDKAVTLEKSRARTDLLMGSLLVTAVSDFEVFFSSIAE